MNKLISLLQKIYERDSNLTKFGIDNSIKIGQEIKQTNAINQIDYLFSSSLVRSIETAYLMFINNDFKFNGNKEILIAPYLREKGNTSSCTPFKPDEQYFRRISLLNLDIPINTISENNIVRGYFDDIEGYDGDLFKFMEWFLNKYFETIKNKNIINVVTVTHSALMQHDFENYIIKNGKEIKSFSERKPHNNSVYKLSMKLPLTFDPESFSINRQINNISVKNTINITKELYEIHNGISEPNELPKDYCESTCTFYDSDKCKTT
jgi:hypothetical protein